MKFTFNKDDAGLYVAFALFGAGAGLIAGSVISSVLRNRKEQAELELINEPNVKPYREMTTSMRKPQEPYVSDQGPEDPELATLIAKYEPSKIQIQMYKAGAVTIEKLEDILSAATDDDLEPVSYSGDYAPNINENLEEKPDLEELTRPKDLVFEKAIDGRYLVHLDATKLQTDVLHVFYYQPEKDIFWARSAYGNLTRVRLVEYVDSDPALAKLGDMLQEQGEGLISIFVEDLREWCAYQFDLYTEDLEEVESGQPNH